MPTVAIFFYILMSSSSFSLFVDFVFSILFDCLCVYLKLGILLYILSSVEFSPPFPLSKLNFLFYSGGCVCVLICIIMTESFSSKLHTYKMWVTSGSSKKVRFEAILAFSIQIFFLSQCVFTFCHKFCVFYFLLKLFNFF